ncbi:MAG: FtsQ-type POTRA domain-containing protein, partial [Desulfobulbaceae bacterium]|nr:FtsQ-type POTRA domain-containing protein [Desulfobulbaceae bacterium]
MKKIRTAQVDRYRPGGGGDHRNVAMMAGLIVFGVCFGLSVVGFIAYQGMLHSDFFQITSINIDGCRRIAKKKVLDLSGVTVHANLLSLDLDEMQKRLEAEDWIAQVTIKRQWPNCLEILVKERKPVALVNLDTGLHFVDRDGVIFAAALPPDEIDFPVISGVKKDV